MGLNWLALAAVLVLAALAAVVWIALAAKLVADDEKTRERAEAERRRLDLLREAVEEERSLAARVEADLAGPEEEEQSPGAGG